MALQVWLPLNGNLNNQGLTDITVTNNGATVDNNGKIGKCYAFNGSSKITNTLPTSIDSSIGTLACWFKMTSLPSSGGFYNLMQLGNLGGYATCRFGVYMEYSNRINISIDGSDVNSNAYTHSLTTNQWYHLCVTHDGITVKLYIDGVEVLSKASTKGSYKTTASNLYVGGTSSYYLKGSMNDARYYDHALSPKEVEVLSRGLVCHYPLNGGGRGGDNLLANTSDLTKWTKEVGITTTWDSDKNMYKIVDSTHTSSRWGIYQDLDITPNTAYTISVDLAGASCGVGLGFYDSGSINYPADVITTTSTTQSRKIYTLTSGASSARCRVYLNTKPGTSTTAWFSLPKLEVGSKSTPWMPNPADTAYTKMGYNSTTEYDVSGYGYNGTKTGTFVYDVDTPRYSVCTNIKNAAYIKIQNLSTTGFSNSYSFAWWGKVPSYTGLMMWGFGDGMRLNGIFNGNLWNTGDGANNPLYVPGTTTQVTVPTTNVWHHWVMTGDGTTCKVYQDGELWATAKTYKSIGSGTTIYINGWDGSTNYKYNNYFMSDFRIYATTLSDTQVAELYNTAVSVANNGTLMGYELVEV